MKLRKNLYVSAGVADFTSYIFNVLAFTGSFDLGRFAVFAVFFLVVMAGFEKFIEWAQRFD
jgi:hypothetical protein